MSNQPSLQGIGSLRECAKQRLQHSGTDLKQTSAEEVARLIYELEVHQEELQIQNEELRRAHLDLQDSRDRYQDLYDFAPVGYLTLNSDGDITAANLTACQLLGRQRVQLIGVRLALFCDVGSRAELRSHLDDVFATDNRCSIELQIAGDGKFDVHLETCRSQNPQDREDQYRTVITDITVRKQAEHAATEKDKRLREEIVDRQRAEDRLREQEKHLAHFARVNTMGEMVAGIAHEINQPLHAISTYATACELKLQQRDADQNTETVNMIRQIAGQAVRSGEIIRRLRAFARKTETSRSLVGISDVIDESIQLTASEVRRHKTTVCTSIDHQLPEVFVDRVQIQQVLVNLIMNACEAMRSVDGGRCITIRAVPLADSVEIVVEDVGEGLVPEMAASIFDAFLSTKADGLGLGLAISRSIIEAHGGRIWATPNSQGTSFQFTLPTGKQALNHAR